MYVQYVMNSTETRNQMPETDMTSRNLAFPHVKEVNNSCLRTTWNLAAFCISITLIFNEIWLLFSKSQILFLFDMDKLHFFLSFWLLLKVNITKATSGKNYSSQFRIRPLGTSSGEWFDWFFTYCFCSSERKNKEE